MKIAILTQILRTNYGGLLQAYALQKTLRDMGHDVVTDRDSVRIRSGFMLDLIRIPLHFATKLLGLQRRSKSETEATKNTDRFIDTHIRNVNFFEGRIYPKKSILRQLDALVVGSDQVWRPLYSNVPIYFLNFAKELPIKKIIYAASFGRDDLAEFTPQMVRQCSDAAKSLDAVSVRESSGVKLCREHFGVEAEHLLDPTMLLDKQDYLELIESEDSVQRSGVMNCYILDNNDTKRSIVRSVADRLTLQPLEVTQQTPHPSISSWLAGFRDAEFVVTDSFHGTIFAIIFNKPFIAISNAERGVSRFTSLLEILGLEDRLITPTEDIDDRLFAPIDYEKVNKIKCEWQARSRKFLTDNL